MKVTKYGTFSIEAKIPKDAPLGYFGVSATGTAPNGKLEANSSFRVEEYRAPQFKADVSAPKTSLVLGEALEATVSARYLFGGAMSDAKTKWSVNRNSTGFSSPAGPDFTFAQETWWWDDREPEAASGFFASGDGRADVKGDLAIKAGQVEAPGEKPFDVYTVEAEVEDVNRQAVAGRVEVTVHPAAFYVGLRSTTGFLKVGTEGAFDTLVVDTAGKKAAGRAVEFQVAGRDQCAQARGEEEIAHPVASVAGAHGVDVVVISAGNGYEQKLEEITVSMEVIKPALIESKNTTNIITVLEQTPGLNILDEEPQIRGGSGFSFGVGSRVATLIDGIPIQAGDAGKTEWCFIPLENIEQIEVIKGASSVLYGSSALSGTINFRTTYPKERSKTRVRLYSGLYDLPRVKQARWWGGPAIFSGVNLFHAEKIKQIEFIVGAQLIYDQFHQCYRQPDFSKYDTHCLHRQRAYG